jgi:hypothetical protein
MSTPGTTRSRTRVARCDAIQARHGALMDERESRRGQSNWRRPARDRACTTRSKIHVRSDFDKGHTAYNYVMSIAIFDKIVSIAISQPKSLKTQGLHCSRRRSSTLFTGPHSGRGRTVHEPASRRMGHCACARKRLAARRTIPTLSWIIPASLTIMSTRDSAARDDAHPDKPSAKSPVLPPNVVAMRRGT